MDGSVADKLITCMAVFFAAAVVFVISASAPAFAAAPKQGALIYSSDRNSYVYEAPSVTDSEAANATDYEAPSVTDKDKEDEEDKSEDLPSENGFKADQEEQTKPADTVLIEEEDVPEAYGWTSEDYYFLAAFPIILSAVILLLVRIRKIGRSKFTDDADA